MQKMLAVLLVVVLSACSAYPMGDEVELMRNPDRDDKTRTGGSSLGMNVVETENAIIFYDSAGGYIDHHIGVAWYAIRNNKRIEFHNRRVRSAGTIIADILRREAPHLLCRTKNAWFGYHQKQTGRGNWSPVADDTYWLFEQRPSLNDLGQQKRLYGEDIVAEVNKAGGWPFGRKTIGNNPSWWGYEYTYLSREVMDKYFPNIC